MFFSYTKKICFFLVLSLIISPIFFLQSKLVFAREDAAAFTGDFEGDLASRTGQSKNRFASLFSMNNAQANISGILNTLSLKVYCGITSLFANSCELNGTTSVTQKPVVESNVVLRNDSVNIFNRTEDRPVVTLTGAETRKTVIEKIVEKVITPVGISGVSAEYVDARIAELAAQLRGEMGDRTITIKTQTGSNFDSISSKQIDSIYENLGNDIDDAIEDLNNLSEDDVIALIMANSSSLPAGTTGYVLQSTGSGVQWVATSTLGFTGGSVDLDNLSDVEVGQSNNANGPSAVTFGYNNTASGAYSPTAIGIYNTASSSYSTAIGSDNQAMAMYSTAAGYGNNANGTYSTSVGYSNNVNGTNSSAFGYDNTVSVTGSSAFGSSVNNNIANSVQIGPSNAAKVTILSSGNVGIGTTTASDRLTVAGSINLTGALKIDGNAGTSGMILQTTGAGLQWVATSSLGISQDLNALSTILVGNANVATGTNSVAFGNQNTVGSGGYGNAFGTFNNVQGGKASVFGYYNTASGYYSSVFGSISDVTGNYSTAVGHNLTVTGAAAFAGGYYSEALADYSTALGYSTRAWGMNAVAVGSQVNATADNSVAIGVSNSASELNSVAIGRGNDSSNEYASAIGTMNSASGLYASAIGYSNSASGAYSNAFGYDNEASEESSSAFGSGIINNIANSVQIGPSNSSKLTILSNGNVGIGTDNPQYSLDIAGATSIGVNYANTAGHALMSVNGGNSFQSGYYIHKEGVEKAQIAILGNSEDLSFSLGGTERFRITDDGNIGIGTSDPLTSIEITQDTPIVRLNGTGASGYIAASYIGVNEFGLYGRNTDEKIAAFDSDQGDYFYGNGNLTIDGVTTRSYLNVVAPGFTAGDGDAANPSVTFSADTNVGLFRPGVNILGFTTADTERMRVDASGNVGIGTSTFSDKLSVAGSINLTGALKANGSAGTSGMVLQTTGSGLQWVATSSLGISQDLNALNSIAIGYLNGTSTLGTAASAVGYQNVASGTNATAFGYRNQGLGSANSVLFGNQNFASSASLSAVAIGLLNNSTGATINTTSGVITGTSTATTTIGVSSVAMGIYNRVTNIRSIAFGIENIITGNSAVAVGWQNTASGGQNLVAGFGNDAASNFSSAVGYDNTAVGNVSQAFGYLNNINASGLQAGAFGHSNTITNQYAFAFGRGNSVSGDSSYVFGGGITNSINNSLMIGPTDTAKLTITSNGNLGIGTTTPAARLTVGSATGTADLISVASSTGARILTVTSAGNVGIGTTTPDRPLVVTGSGFSLANFRTISTSDRSTALSITNNNGSGDTWDIAVGGAGNGLGFTNGELYMGANGKDFALRNKTSGGESLRVNSGGNVGIGTSTIVERLTLAYDDNGFSNGFSIQNTNAGINNVTGMILKNRTGTAVGAFQYVHSNFSNASLQNTVLFGSIGQQKVGFIANSGGSVGQDIYFQTHSTQLTPQLLINGSTGNVGIGTTTPISKLTVVGTAGTADVFTVASSTNASFLSVSSAGHVTAANSLSVGGSKYGSAPLTVSYDSGSSAGLIVKANSGSDTFASFISSSNSTLAQITGAGGAYFASNVGIGATGPDRKLVVTETDAAYVPAAFRHNASNGYAGVHFLNSSGTIMGHAGYGNPSAAGVPDMFYVGSVAAKDVVLTSSGTIRMTVTSGGNVGIATSSPSDLFTVAGSMNLTGAFKANGNAGSNGNVLVSTGTSTQWVATSTLGFLGLDSLNALSPIAVGSGNATTTAGTAASLFGYQNTATGTNSTVVGYQNVGLTANSVLLGNRNFTSSNGISSVAVGMLNNSHGATFNTTSGAITGTTTATSTVGIGSTAVGILNFAKGDLAQVFGYNNSVMVGNGIAIGSNNLIYSGTNGASTFGNTNTVSANIGSAFGNANNVSGAFGNAFGYQNSSSGSAALAYGYINTASTNSGAFGRNINASNGSFGYGHTMNLTGATAFAYGYNLTSSVSGVTIGKDITNSTASSLQIGMGDNAKMSILTTGQVGIGTTSPSARLAIVGTAISTENIFTVSSSTAAMERFLTVSHLGNVGIGTSTPSAKLDITDAPTSLPIALRMTSINSGDYTGMRFGTSAATKGAFMFMESSEYNSWGRGDFVFALNNAGDTTSAAASDERLRITANGNVGIGTSTPGQKLSVVGSAQFTGVGSGAYAFDLNLTSDGTLTTSASDERLKENIEILDSKETLGKLMQLKPATFDWRSNGSHDIGLIAQEVEEIFPELVFTNKTDGFKGVNYSRLPALLISGIQELNGMFDSFVEYVEDGVAYINEIVVKRFTAKQITVQNEDLYKTGVTIYDQKTGEPICMFVFDGEMKTEPGRCEDREEPEDEEEEEIDEPDEEQNPDDNQEGDTGGGADENPPAETPENPETPDDSSDNQPPADDGQSNEPSGDQGGGDAPGASGDESGSEDSGSNDGSSNDSDGDSGSSSGSSDGGTSGGSDSGSSDGGSSSGSDSSGSSTP